MLKKARMRFGKKVIIWGMAMLFPFLATSQTKLDEDLQKTFAEYKQIIFEGRFDALWDFLLPEIHKKLEKAYERIKTDPEYRYEFVTTNWYGESDEKVQILKLGSAKGVFIALARLAQKEEADAYGEEFGEGFKTGKIKRVWVGEVKWIPELKGYVSGFGFLPGAYKHMKKKEDSFWEGIVIYQLADGDEINRYFIKREGKWKPVGSPVYIWISDDEQLDPESEHFEGIFK